MFADDTNLFISGKDLNETMNIANSELQKVHGWFLANRLTINLEKTSFMLFKSKNFIINDSVLKIQIGNCFIKRIEQTKFLGIIIDEKLTWKNHVNDISSKIAKAVGVINRIKFIVPKKVQ